MAARGTALLGLAAVLAAAPAGAESAERLAHGCLFCHAAEGDGPAMTYPALAGQHRDYLIENLLLFQRGARKGTVMTRLARGFTPAELERLADHYAAQPSPRAAQPTDPALVARGRRIHKDGCNDCHREEGRGFDREKAGQPGPRLAGQNLGYLRVALEEFKYRDRDMLVHMGMKFVGPGDADLDALAHFYASRR